MNAGNYEIVIKGLIGDELARSIDGFRVLRADHGMTHLVGTVQDQARLRGILDMLAGFNIELISVNPILTPR